MSKPGRSTVLTLRVPPELDRRIAAQARRRRRTKSDVLREVLRGAFGGEEASDPAREARRQSLMVSGRRSERDAMEFIESAADDRGWR